jgi:hypothetical protein
MAATIRRFGTGALWTGPIGLDGRQAAPLVLSEQTAQLRVLGEKIADVLVAHRRHFTSFLTGRPMRPTLT